MFDANITWNSQGTPEQQTVLARFVLEGLPQIENLVASAEGILEQNTGDPSFDAYISGNPARVREQVRALYEGIRKLGLTYRIEPWDSRRAMQVIRCADTVLAKGHGCCIDLVLLLSSAVRHVGIHPLVMVVGDDTGPTHAVLGYWTEEDLLTGLAGLPQPVLTWDVLQKHLAKIKFVECTDMAGEPSRNFDRAEQDALSHLPPNPGRRVWYAVDVDACRRLGIRPAEGVQNTLGTLIGFAIDLSGSMRESISNNTGGSMSRFESFRQALTRLADDARRLADRAKEAKVPSQIRIFVYGFGLRQGGVCDLLSLVQVAGDVVSRDEIESMKQRYASELEAQYSGYGGLASLARQYGFGGIVDAVESEARRRAEDAVRTRIEAEIARRLQGRLHSLGETTVTPEKLVELWSDSAERMEGAEAFIYGATPMREALEVTAARFTRELGAQPAGTQAVLFLLSDGAPTDGNPLPVAQRLKAMGVTIVSCLITNRDIVEPKRLYGRSEGDWKQEPRLMFDMASRLPIPSPFADYLGHQQWKIPPRARLFIQANHSQVVEEFARVVLSPMSEQLRSHPPTVEDDQPG